MIVYADVLFFLNSVIDYFLIGITAIFMRIKIRTFRQIMAALLGGIFSFYIFLDIENLAVDLLYRIITTTILIFCSFGYKHFLFFIKSVSVFFISSVFLFGLTFILYRSFNFSKIVINNTYFYFNFSPLFAIFLTFVTFLTIKLFRRFSSRKLISKECVVEFSIEGSYIKANAYIDTGNLAKDYLSDSELCFVSESLFSRFTGCNSISEILEIKEYQSRYRTIPITTLNETSLLDGLRCDAGKIYLDKNVYSLYKPIIVISNNLPKNFDVIVSAKTLEKIPENILKGDTIETF